jgi:hypothetical protein
MNNEQSNRADELMTRAARDYNEPGVVPREEIWNRIAGARRAAGVAPTASRSRRMPGMPGWAWPALGAAAAGLVAVGVAIGRSVERSQSRNPQKPSIETAQHDSNGTTRSPNVAPSIEQGTNSVPSLSAPMPDSQRAAPADADVNSATVAYQLAVLQHVAGSEAMITAFRASARRGDVDAQLATWSRHLLGETRMLESSAPPGDATMKRLLQDLELVLAQIVQYTNHDTHAPDDLDLIERSIKRRAVMSNLRAMSTGRLPSGT